MTELLRMSDISLHPGNMDNYLKKLRFMDSVETNNSHIKQFESTL